MVQILPKNADHGTAQGDDLGFSVFGVAVEDHTRIQIHVTDLDGSDRCRSAAAVQQEVDDDPIPVFRKSRFANVGLF